MKSKGTRAHGAGERVFDGFSVGTGIAIGIVHRHDSRAVVQVRERRIPAAKVRTEQHRMLEAAADEVGTLVGTDRLTNFTLAPVG